MDQKEFEKYRSYWESQSDEDLIKAIKYDKEQYRSEVLAIIAEEIERRQLSMPFIERTEDEIKQRKDEQIKSYTGIKGFLLLFIIVVILNSIIYLVSGIAAINQNANGLLTVLFFVGSMFIGAYGIFTSYYLIKTHETAINKARYWLYSILIFTLLFIPFGNTGGVSVIARNIIFAAIWLGYLSYSKRVAVTYGKQEIVSQEQ